MEEKSVVAFEGIHNEFGIRKSRTQIKRDEDAGKFPKRLPKTYGGPKIRSYWWRHEIRAWLSGTWRPDPTPAPKKK